MRNHKISLNEAIKFHGHLGPWLVLGLVMGEYALKKLKANKYFGLKVKVWGANRRPKSCLIDGLQLSTGATYGKGNIRKVSSDKVMVDFSGSGDKRGIVCILNKRLETRLKNTHDHKENEKLAKKIYSLNPGTLFNIKTKKVA
ncbi:MAG: formylmethanofuran dehydrogenase subunit E family protein [Candidatus Omnitrophica bacterium]|nr:formylmethanofuran dehydrogenase subunit E family protein [Candidatus Omnitrophota bacterium]